MSDGSVTDGPQQAAPPLTVIRPPKGWEFPDFRELLAYHDLLLFLVVRNIKVRYRQTLLGGAWAIVQPLATMLMLTFVFGKLIGVPSGGVPYWIFSLSGVVLWSFISQALSTVSLSLVNSSQLVEKIYFPRLAIPIAAVIAAFIDFLISFAMLLAILAATGFGLSPRLPLALVAGLLAGLVVFGFGTALSALSVRYRDVNYVIPFAVQLWLFATPIVYPISIVPEQWRPLLALNPATGLVELFRWATIGTTESPWPYLPYSIVTLLLLLVGGLLIFRRMEHSFADVI
jgi:lipopolysaccharide transport system permease protein